MNSSMSGIIGVVGGIIDLAAGFILLQSRMMDPMSPGNALLAAYLLLGLGIIVLATGLYLLVSPSMRPLFGRLMLLYGSIMLVLGLGMIAQLFSVMRGSNISGVVMILSGLAMIYSGLTMPKGKM